MTDDLFGNLSSVQDNEQSNQDEQDHQEGHHFFNCDIIPSSFKDDVAAMDVPIFTLSTKTPDLSILEWVSHDGKNKIQVIPSVLGKATQLDKDLLIYAISQLTEGLNQGRADAKSSTVRFKIYDYLKATGKSIGGTDYKRIKKQLDRLRGTFLSTTIKTGNISSTESRGLIADYRITEGGPDMVLAVEMVLSKWIFNSIQAREVLTINPKYFTLKRTLERKLYEIARRHCGAKKSFKISMEILMSKMGTESTVKEFRRNLKEIIESKQIPDYQYAIIDEDNVMIHNENFNKMIN